MANIQVFEYQNSKVRTVDMDGEAWFVLKDVCAVLGISNNRMAADRLDDDEKGVSLIDTLGGKQEMVIVNESGLYHIILRSDKPEAAPFRRWVTNDVLPTIRKTGSYNAPQLTRSQLLATALIAAHEELEQKDKQIETMKPKVLFADAVSASKKSILVGELAKLLSQNGISIGQNRLFDWMRKNSYLIKDPKRSDYNLPTQRSMEMGLFEIKETTIQHSDHVSINRTPKVTGKGQVYFVNLFLKSEKQEPTVPSDFELEVKMKLLQRGMKQTELIQEVQSDTGLFLDDSYLYKILRGERKPEKIIQSICKILEIKQNTENEPQM